MVVCSSGGCSVDMGGSRRWRLFGLRLLVTHPKTSNAVIVTHFNLYSDSRLRKALMLSRRRDSSANASSVRLQWSRKEEPSIMASIIEQLPRITAGQHLLYTTSTDTGINRDPPTVLLPLSPSIPSSHHPYFIPQPYLSHIHFQYESCRANPKGSSEEKQISPLFSQQPSSLCPSSS